MESNTILEQEIADIEKRLAEKKALRQAQGESAEGADLLHETVGDKIKEALTGDANVSQQNVVQAVTPTPAPLVSEGDSPAYALPEMHDRIQALVNIAFTKGVAEAVKQIASDPNKALVDAFHAALVDQVREEMIKQGKLKSI